MILFEIHERFKGHFLNELRVSFNQLHCMVNWLVSLHGIFFFQIGKVEYST